MPRGKQNKRCVVFKLSNVEGQKMFCVLKTMDTPTQARKWMKANASEGDVLQVGYLLDEPMQAAVEIQRTISFGPVELKSVDD